MRLKLVLEYEGTRYSGWQQQADAKTVQGALLEAAARVFPGEPLDLQGCGRTDAGVHALRYPAHLEVRTTDLALPAICEKMNAHLPADINVLAVEAVPPDFHARHHCLGRSYLYQIARRRTAFCRRYVYSVREPLAASRMAAAAQLLAGMHDFAAFADRRALKKKSPRVFVNKAEIAESEEVILFRIVGSHFLWKMVRNIVGVLIEIGAGRQTEADLQRLLAGEAALPPGLAVPAAGLFLETAFFEEDAFTDFLAKEPLRPRFF